MKTTNEILAILHEFKQTTADKYGIESLALVGSAARGEQRENSDIDVCVKLRKTTFRAYMTIKEELEHLFHTKVDLITNSIHHQNHCSDKQLSGFSQFRRWHGIIQFDVYVPANYW